MDESMGQRWEKVAEGRVSDVTLCGKRLMVSFDDEDPDGDMERIEDGFDLFDENCSSKYFFGGGSGDQKGELSVLTDVHRRTVSQVIESLKGCAKLDKDLLLLKCSRKQIVDHIDKEFKNDKVQKKVLLFKFYVLLGRDEEEFASRGKEVMNKKAQGRVIEDGQLAKKDVAFDDKASIERVREVCARFANAKQEICHRNLRHLIISNAYVVAPASKGAPKGGRKASTRRAGDAASDGAPSSGNSGNDGRHQHIVLWLVDLVNQELPCGRSTSSPVNAGANRDAQGPRKVAASKSGGVQAPAGWLVQKVPPDGNCGYHAFLAGLERLGRASRSKDASGLRQEVVKDIEWRLTEDASELRATKDRVSLGLGGGGISPAAWMMDAELGILARLYEVHVSVYKLPAEWDKRPAEWDKHIRCGSGSSTSDNTIVLINFNGRHFDLLVPNPASPSSERAGAFGEALAVEDLNVAEAKNETGDADPANETKQGGEMNQAEIQENYRTDNADAIEEARKHPSYEHPTYHFLLDAGK